MRNFSVTIIKNPFWSIIIVVEKNEVATMNFRRPRTKKNGFKTTSIFIAVKLLKEHSRAKPEFKEATKNNFSKKCTCILFAITLLGDRN